MHYHLSLTCFGAYWTIFRENFFVCSKLLTPKMAHLAPKRVGEWWQNTCVTVYVCCVGVFRTQIMKNAWNGELGEVRCPQDAHLQLVTLSNSFNLHKDTTPPQPNHTVTPTHIEPEQYNTWNKPTISRKLLKMDVLTFETCWALNSEIINQVSSSWSIFIQLCRSVFSNVGTEFLSIIYINSAFQNIVKAGHVTLTLALP